MADLPKPTPLSLRKAFGQILRTVREDKDLTQVDVSAATSLGLRTIRSAELAEKSPTLDTMEIFAVFYDVPLEELLTRARHLRDTTLL
jgi:transcriptional regulator with XRE-family HTH domain